MRAKEFLILEAISNPAVIKTQEKLRDLGYDLGPYGPKVDGVDGIVGPYTKAAMDAYAKGIDPKNTQKPDAIEIQKYNKKNRPARKILSKQEPAIVPVEGPVSSPFGYRTSVGPARNHNGTDFSVPVGTEVVAPANGVITGAGNSKGGEGTYVILDADGVVHKFFHLSKILVRTGDQVTAGEVIALTGNSGHSTGPHLHWETHVAGRPMDPMRNVA